MTSDNTAKMGRPRKLDKPRKYYSILLDPDLIIRADVLVTIRKAADTGYSRSDLINEAIAEYLVRQAE